MDAGKLKIAEHLLACFRGRADYVARATATGFEPAKLPGPMQPSWLARHLDGIQGAGFYLMDPESRVWCSCVDFDNKAEHPDPEWKDKTEKLYLWIQNLGLAPLVEISQSGTAAHVWLFFEEATDAWVPRAFFRNAATKLGLEFREIYPRQDHLTGKGLGNLVRYPLWNQSRFVDPESDWADLDPLAALAEIKRTSGAELKSLAYELAMEMSPDEPAATTYQTATNGQAVRGDLPPRVKARLGREGTLLYRRWHGDRSEMRDQSTSALVVSIACELVRQMVPTAEIEAAIRYWCEKNDYEKGLKDRAVARAVSVAYEYVNQRKEERSSDSVTMKDACLLYIAMLARGEATHVASGIRALDQSVDGVGYGEMCVIAARPGHGKSCLALEWMDAAAHQGIHCLMISEEMSALELGKRSLTCITNHPQQDWGPDLKDMLTSDVVKHYEKRAPIHIVEACDSVERAEEKIDSYCCDRGVRVVAVDYMQLLGGRGQRRYEQVTDVSRKLKQAAKRNNCAMLVCCQVNREVEDRAPEYKPQLSDLRDSGSIEQDADIVLFVQWMHKFDISYTDIEYRIYAEKRRNGPIRERLVKTNFFADRQVIGEFREWYARTAHANGQKQP